ncbi:PLxRFG domain-containing protein [Enterovirga rhinocerotis]|uniref:Large polyvalent protein-associated domain-containing protein n=1 Tax=Enterovirga rhinocerotis TaxID=1339210 RepID=A0A4R7BWI1_9HYPH|nr:PLxRFG domain-containing protein [Enterovirga rhinocerotis]TDR90258.1 hypothetical protein EV668_3100 [Enterovirga rhinocerotis]
MSDGFSASPLDQVLAESQTKLRQASTAPVGPAFQSDQPEPAMPEPALLTAFESTADRYGIPVDALLAMAQKDSNFDPLARSRGIGPKSRGIVRISDDDLTRTGINPYQPEQALGVAAQKIKGYLDKGMSMEDAIKATVGGPNKETWGPEVQQYYDDVMGRAGKLADALYPAQPEPAPAPAAPPSDGTWYGDIGRAVDRGVGSVMNMPFEIASAMGSEWAEKQAKGVRDYNEESRKRDSAGLHASREAFDKVGGRIGKRMKEGDLAGATGWLSAIADNPMDAIRDFGESVAAIGTDPRLLTTTIAESAPSMLAVGAGGGVGAVAARAAGGSAGAGSALGIFLSSSGMSASSIAETINGDVDKMKGSDLRRLAPQAKTLEEAKRTVKQNAFLTVETLAAAGLAGSIDLIGRGAEKMIAGGLRETGGILRTAAKGAATEAAQETGQSALEAAAGARAQDSYQPEQDNWSGVLRETAAGAVAGAGMGAGTGAISGARGRNDHSNPFSALDPAVQAEAGDGYVTAGTVPSAPTQASPAPSEPVMKPIPPTSPETVAPASAPAGPLARALDVGAPQLREVAKPAGSVVVVTDETGQRVGRIVGQDSDGIMFEDADGVVELLSPDDITNGIVQVTTPEDAPRVPQAPAAPIVAESAEPVQAPVADTTGLVAMGGGLAGAITDSFYGGWFDLLSRKEGASSAFRAERLYPATRRAFDAGEITSPADLKAFLDRSEKAPAEKEGETRPFAPETGALGVPRAEMPQVASEHHGALVNHLNAKGIAHETTEVDAGALKPTQAEYEPAKVKRAKAEGNGERSVIVSNDGHIVDGHHQAVAAAEEDRPVRAIVLDATAEEALEAVKAFPSVRTAGTSEGKVREVEKTLAEMSEPELRERLKYVAGQAKANGGWGKRWIEARREVEREIGRRQRGAQSFGSPVAAKPEKPVAMKAASSNAAQAVVGRSFGSPEKAEARLAKLNLSATHEVVQTGKVRWEIKPRQTAAPAPTEKQAPAPVAAPAAKPSAKEKAAAERARIDDYFTPGNIVPSYGGGADRVVSFSRGKDGEISVTVEAVRKDGDRWVGTGERRTHSTQPGPRERVIERASPKFDPVGDMVQAEAGPTAAEPEAKADPFAGNKLFTSDAVAKARARMKNKLSSPKPSVAHGEPEGMSSEALSEHLTSGEDAALIAKLISAGHIVLHDNASSLPDGIGAPDGVQGVTMADGTIHLVSGNLTPATARSVLLHEMFHAGTQPLIGERQWGALLDRVRRATDAAMARSRAGTSHASDAFWRDAGERAGAAGTPTEHLAEEVAAYAIESRERAPAGLREMADSLVGRVKAWVLRTFGHQLGAVTPSQLRALAVSALRSWRDAPIVSSDGGTRYSVAATVELQPDRKGTLFDRAQRQASSFLTNAMAGKLTPLALVPTRPLFMELARDLPSARKYLRTKEAMDAMRNDLSTEVAPIVEKWGTFALRHRGENRALADLMHDTTIAQLDPSEPPRLKAGDPRRAEYLALRQRFEALPKAARDIYTKARDFYEERADQSEREVIANMRRAIDAAAKRADREHAAEMQRISDKGLTGKERAEAVAEADRKRTLAQSRTRRMRNARLKRLREQFESNRLAGPYFPLARFGRFFVTVRDADGKVVSFSRFESVGESEDFAAQMRRDRANTVEVGLIEEKTRAESFLDPKFVADVDAILDAGHASLAVRDQVWQRYLETLPDLSMRKKRLHRKNRAGYSSDALRAFASSMFHSAHQISRLRYGLELGEHLDEAGSEVKSAKDPYRSGAVFDEMRRAHDFTMNPDIKGWSHNVTSAVFLWTMWANISSALVNLDQAWSKGVPVLGFDAETGNVGTRRAAAYMAAALVDFLRGRTFVANSPSLSADEREAIGKAYESGVIDKTQAHDLAGVADRGVRYNPFWAKLMKFGSAPMHQTERLNREITFLAAYRLARDSGLAHDPAIVKAGDLTWMTHYDNQASGKARLMRGSTGRAIFALKSFQANVLYRLFRDLHQATQDLPPAERKAAIGRLTATIMLSLPMAGLKGFAGISVLMSIAGLFMGAAGDDRDPEEALRKAVLEAAGDTLIGQAAGGMLMDGIPGYLTGTSLSGRVGMGDLWFRSNNRDMNAEQQFTYVLEQLLGAPVGLMHQVWQGGADIARGNVTRGFEKMAPAALRNPVKAARYATEGVRDKSGDTVVERVAPQDVIKQMIGFTPAEIADRHERNNFQHNMKSRIQGEQAALRRAAAEARRAGDPDRLAKAMAEVDAFNDRHPRYEVDRQSIRRAQRAMESRSRRKEFGVDLPTSIAPLIRESTAPSIYSRRE